NFDAKIRRQSLDPEDLILAHVGGMDTCARALKAAASMLEDGTLERLRADRYAGWDAPGAKAMLTSDLAAIADRVERDGIDPQPRSGRQERLENLVNRFV
ncbi:MAG: xylose isomerase, partial [Rhodobacteraceae bacterium]|nr:xylose isomerase [Paracoccaceae bacterium]